MTDISVYYHINIFYQIKDVKVIHIIKVYT